MWGKSRFTVVLMGNNKINNNARIDCVLYTYNCKPTFAPPCISMYMEYKILLKYIKYLLYTEVGKSRFTVVIQINK